jgi:hypothetical protein
MNSSGKNNYWKYLVLVLAFMAVVVIHQFAYIGHYGYDDLNYARISHNLLEGNVDYNDHFTYRFPLVYLTAVSYKLFGISDFASSLPPIAITFLILFVVFLVLKKKPIGVLILGLGLTLFNQWFLFYSDKLMPDIYVALSVIFSLFIIYRYKYESDKSNPAIYATLLSAGLLFGFVSKGTIILIIPLLLYIFIVDVFLKRDMKFWFYFAISGVLMLMAYLLYIKYLTGNTMQRFDALLNNSYLNRCSYDRQSRVLLYKRIGYEFYAMFIYTGLITGVAIAISYFFQKNIKNAFRLDSPFTFFLVSTLLLFLSANFMSISLTSYVPMCLDPRHYLYIVPVAAIPASEIIYSFFKDRKLAAQLLIVFLLLTVASFFLEGNSFWGIYFPLFLLLLIAYLLNNRVKNKRIYIILFVVVLMVYPLNMIKYGQNVKYPEQREFIYRHIINPEENVYVISNDVQKRLGDYYLGFNEDSPVTFLSYDSFDIDTLDKNKKIYLLLNPYTRFLKRLSINDIPFYTRDPEKYGTLVFEDKRVEMKVYDLTGLSNPYNETNKLLHSFNGFEKDAEFWDYTPIEASTQIIYEGEHSSAVGEYSATFKYLLDSLAVDSNSKILITVSVQCFFNAPTKAKLVISTDPIIGEGTWQAFDINKYIKAYGNWWPVEYETLIVPDEIKPGTVLKIYIYNPEKEDAYIDDFEINIYKIK